MAFVVENHLRCWRPRIISDAIGAGERNQRLTQAQAVGVGVSDFFRVITAVSPVRTYSWTHGGFEAN